MSVSHKYIRGGIVAGMKRIARNSTALGRALVLLTVFYSAFGQGAEITINNIKQTQGQIIITLFDIEEQFLMKSDLSLEVAIKQKPTQVVRWKKEIPEKFALTVVHDLNGNGKLDTGMFNVPLEPFGFSNNVVNHFGPPKFQEVLLSREQFNQGIIVNLREFSLPSGEQ